MFISKLTLSSPGKENIIRTLKKIFFYFYFRMIFILAVALTGGSILTEKTEGTIERCLIAGVNMYEVLFSHIITEFVIVAGQVALILGFAFIIFDIQNSGPWILVILLSLLEGINGMSLGKNTLRYFITFQ